MLAGTSKSRLINTTGGMLRLAGIWRILIEEILFSKTYPVARGFPTPEFRHGFDGAHLANTTMVDSLSLQRSAGRGLGRGASDQCLPMVPEELLLSPTLSSTSRRRGGWW
jgi:hypothetical protein